MIIGIVGAEGSKFTLEGERQAKELITHILLEGDKVTEVCSGECHLGGIDIWTREIALMVGVRYTGFPPKTRSWEGYKARNIQIAEHSAVVHNIVVDHLPPNFKGMTHKLCYHCGTTDHVKSGGCWTAKRAKEGIWHIVSQ